MSVLVVGLSHRTAPVALLERVSVTGDALVKLLHDVQRDPAVAEAMVVSTCNRVEVYAVVDRFHTAVNGLSELLGVHSGVPLDQLSAHLYVHYEDRAVEHLFSVAAGLDSMVLGEGQILGQVRSALRLAQEEGTLGATLNELVQQALRVGKRSHAETGIDRAGASLVGVGLTLAGRVLGPIGDRTALVVGAGSMSSLSAATLQRAGVTDIVVVNRTHERAVRLAQAVGGRAAEFGELAAELARADLVISCTGATDLVITADMVPAREMFLLDLALPRDVDPAVRDLPGVTLVDLESMQDGTADADTDDGGRAEAIVAVREIVAEEVAAYLSAERASRSPRPWSRCAARPPTWWRRSSDGSSPGSRSSTGGPGTRSPRRSGAWSTSCSTSPPCVSSSSRSPRREIIMPRRCASCSTWTRRSPPQ